MDGIIITICSGAVIDDASGSDDMEETGIPSIVTKLRQGFLHGEGPRFLDSDGKCK